MQKTHLIVQNVQDQVVDDLVVRWCATDLGYMRDWESHNYFDKLELWHLGNLCRYERVQSMGMLV